MKVSCELHAAAVLLSRNEPPVPIQYEAGWVPQPAWTL